MDSNNALIKLHYVLINIHSLQLSWKRFQWPYGVEQTHKRPKMHTYSDCRSSVQTRRRFRTQNHLQERDSALSIQFSHLLNLLNLVPPQFFYGEGKFLQQVSHLCNMARSTMGYGCVRVIMHVPWKHIFDHNVKTRIFDHCFVEFTWSPIIFNHCFVNFTWKPTDLVIYEWFSFSRFSRPFTSKWGAFTSKSRVFTRPFFSDHTRFCQVPAVFVHSWWN